MVDKVEVLIIGRINLDYLNILERYPEEDSKIMIMERLVETGGHGSNNSTCIAKLGGFHRLIGCVGDDEEGKFCLRKFFESGVNTDSVRIIPGDRTPVSYIFITRSSGKRTIMYDPEMLSAIHVTDEIRSYIQASKTLLIDPSTTYLAKELSEIQNRPPIIYDCEYFREGMEDMMTTADYFVPSAKFLDDKKLALKADTFVGKIKEISKKVSGRIIVTAAENGAYFIEDGEIFQIEPPKTEIIDTTGAGDNFHGALALALSRDFPLKEAVKFSVATATLSCRGYGGRIAVPERDEAVGISGNLKTRKVCGVDS